MEDWRDEGPGLGVSVGEERIGMWCGTYGHLNRAISASESTIWLLVGHTRAVGTFGGRLWTYEGVYLRMKLP